MSFSHTPRFETYAAFSPQTGGATLTVLSLLIWTVMMSDFEGYGDVKGLFLVAKLIAYALLWINVKKWPVPFLVWKASSQNAYLWMKRETTMVLHKNKRCSYQVQVWSQVESHSAIKKVIEILLKLWLDWILYPKVRFLYTAKKRWIKPDIETYGTDRVTRGISGSMTKS